MGKGPVCNLEDSPFYVFRACARGLTDTVERLIEEDRGRATGKDTKGWTCMHHAASRDKVIIMDLVLKYSNTTLNAVNVDGNTPLHLAAEGNRKNAVRHLLILGADPNILNHKNAAPLHLATTNCHHLVVKELLANAKVDVNIKSKNGSTAIHLAAVLNHKETTKVLVEGGANLCQPNSHGFYPVHLAAKHASNAALELILDAAEAQGVSREKMFSFLDAENNSPLHSAVNGGDSEAVRMCVLNGAKVDARSDDDATPFHLACNQGNLDVVRLMLDIFEKQEGEIISLLEAEDINGLTPMHRAAVYDHPDVVKFLISKEANFEAKDTEGRTPLLLCAAKGGGGSLRALMEAGASVSVRDTNSKNVLHFLVSHGERMTEELGLIYKSPKGKSLLDQQDVAGCTPLHLATRTGNLAFLDSLLSLGATVSTKDNADQSVLHFAARYGRTNTVRKLLEHSGRIMNETDGVGMTPLHVAAASGHSKVVSLLLQRGALIHKDFQGQTPLHLAAERGHTQSMKLLLSYHRNLLDIADKRQNSALHLASVTNEAGSVDLLLSWDAEYGPNAEDRSPLDLCVQNLCEEAALTMVASDRWKEFLSHDSSLYGSPLLGLIQYLPNVHKAVLDRCRIPSKAHIASKHYWEKFDFSLMEAPRGTAAKMAERLSESGEGRIRIKEALLCCNTMVRFGRVSLLSHPVSLAYLNMKWKAYGSWFFYINLGFYMIFLGAMTWLLCLMNQDPSVSPHLVRAINDSCDLVVPANYSYVPNTHYYGNNMSGSGRVALIFIVCFLVVNYIKEFMQIYQQKIMYFLDLVNMIEWSLYVSAMAFAGPLLFLGSVHAVQWQFGVVAIFLAWFNVLMHLQRTEAMGLYVVMFLHIFRTVVKVIGIFSVLFIGFGLAFHILFTNDPIRGWDGPIRSIIQSVMMMMGEWYFLHNFVEPMNAAATYALPFPSLSLLFLLLFVLLMPLLFINLLIGLAVGDIEMVQKDARLKRLAMQVEYHTELEERLPHWLTKRIAKGKGEITLYPNKISSTDLVASIVRWIHMLSGKQEDVKTKDVSLVSLQERRSLEIIANIASLKKRVESVEAEQAVKMEKLSDLLRLVAQKLEIHSEADVFDEGEVAHSGPTSRASYADDLVSLADIGGTLDTLGLVSGEEEKASGSGFATRMLDVFSRIGGAFEGLSLTPMAARKADKLTPRPTEEKKFAFM